ncbi:hypothetical protein Pcinc_002515 [Petrolisthes cinctipes]|uniref:Putative nuclease HARBI1 n=1 Tax=Petrolisthes cinctipes TaxID=88211 RepID=A0AAE1GQ63_PETCI|nr:hypothetical protein Pcinc_012340 [Petrolisthes cinctipes]KAK3893688.1 hypothetical protein Pcinc_002515 [Petrolisthes cinctipes]
MAEGIQGRIRRRRVFSERKDILNMYNDAELVKRYRLDRAGILLVTDFVRDAITPPTGRNRAIPAELKVITTLRYLATGKMQLCNGDDIGMTQQAASKMITQTLDALVTPPAAFISRFVKFPRMQDEIRQRKAEFREIANFPEVVGAIDGTHIRIVAPREYEAEYINRKNYHSINVQVVFDARYRILDVVAKWPGSVHDSRMWNECGLKEGFENGTIPRNCHLIGDSGYPSRPWLLTPYLQPRTEIQEAYNRAHKPTRCVVERGIGQLKRRFHVLHGEVRVSPAKTSQIVMVCAALHNLCKERNLDLPDEPDIDQQQLEDRPEEPNHIQPFVPDGVQGGILYRDNFATLHFQPEQ